MTYPQHGRIEIESPGGSRRIRSRCRFSRLFSPCRTLHSRSFNHAAKMHHFCSAIFGPPDSGCRPIRSDKAASVKSGSPCQDYKPGWISDRPLQYYGNTSRWGGRVSPWVVVQTCQTVCILGAIPMRDVFQVCRHRMGLVLLGLGCALVMLWFRSLLVSDEFHSDQSECFFLTGDGSLFWYRKQTEWEVMLDHTCCVISDQGWRWRSVPCDDQLLYPDADCAVQSTSSVPGIEFFIAKRNCELLDAKWADTFTCWRISLFWLAVPPYLLSAVLLLRPLHQTQKT